eukprot:COSAG02_NODE_58453_length_277_cov_0.842697_1_plen_65_part_01
MESNMTMLELDNAVMEMDTDGDGEVTLLEFMAWYAGKSKLRKRIMKGVNRIKAQELADAPGVDEE